jgi:tol-pal system protein YbgF
MCGAGKLLARLSLATFALLTTGLTWGVAEVESRNTGGVWVTQDQSPPEGSSLDLMKKIEFLQQEMQELRGKVEEQAYTIQQMQEAQKKLYVDLDSRISGGASKSPTTGIDIDDNALDLDSHTSTTNSPTLHLSTTMPSPEAIVAEEKAYQQAYRLVQRKDYDGAVAAFQALNQQFPQGKYSPNANYWLGEIYLTRHQFDLANQAFDLVYRQYPQHPKAADALLKMGYVAYGQGQFKRAETLFNQVKSKFPNSTSSQLADAKLSRMAHDGQA